MARAIPLKCQSCGGRLEIHADMTTFACGYCGTEIVVERRGGTVSLRVVTDAIHRVEAGTAKTAAELALVRLKQDLSRKEAERNRMATEASHPSAIHALFGYGVFGVILGIGFALASLVPDAGVILIVLFGVGGVVAMLSLLQRAKRKRAQDFQERLASLDREVASLNTQIAERHAVANDVL